ncbi:hypothetical protein HDG37_001828 [Paraburkholderia sp. MM5384-R2]|nr:hypothetical protein [Paraburkholderia sp. MM5384-R2]
MERPDAFGGRLADPLVIALCLNRLRDLKDVAQSLVFNDRGLIDLGQPVVLPARQNTAVHPEFDTPIRVLPDLDISINQLAVLRRVLQQVHDLVVLQRSASTVQSNNSVNPKSRSQQDLTARVGVFISF